MPNWWEALAVAHGVWAAGAISVPVVPIYREHELADWELLTDALFGSVARAGLMNVDELRRGIESMPPEDYEQAAYYERWAFSIERILTEKGVLGPAEVDSRL